MSLGKFLDPKNDFAFKQIFGNVKNKEILIRFLNDMIPFPENDKIVDLIFLKPSQDPETFSKKQSVVDVLCTDTHGCQYIVEMQVAHTEGFEKRAQYYAAKAYGSQMNVGDEYQNLKEIIFLAFTDFILFPNKKAYKSDHVILDKVTSEHDLKDFYFCFVELPKFNKTISELSNSTERWIYFLKHAPETTPDELEALIGNDTILAQAYKALDSFYWSPEQIYYYDQQLKNLRDHKAMLRYAQSEGESKAKRQMAWKLLQEGVNINVVQKVTGFSPEALATLAEPESATSLNPIYIPPQISQ
jgi:predicted transposase/invertase (TIGR01784 family)